MGVPTPGPVYSNMTTQRVVNVSTPTGYKVYSYYQQWQFIDLFKYTGICKIEACSVSEDLINASSDNSTNYCNIHNLYCSDAVCHPINPGLSIIETKLKPVNNASANVSKCSKGIIADELMTIIM